MATDAMHQSPAGAGLSRWVAVGFLAGAISVLVLHQGAIALLHVLEWTRAPYSMQPTQPLGVLQLWSLTFVVAPLKGQPIAGGFAPMALAIGPIVNGAWGLGTGIGLALLGRPHVRRNR